MSDSKLPCNYSPEDTRSFQDLMKETLTVLGNINKGVEQIQLSQIQMQNSMTRFNETVETLLHRSP